MKSKKRKIESHDSNPAKKPKYKDVSDIPDKVGPKVEHPRNLDSCEKTKTKRIKHKHKGKNSIMSMVEKDVKLKIAKVKHTVPSVGFAEEVTTNNAHSPEESIKKSSSCMKHKKKDKSMKHKKKDKKSKKHKNNKTEDERSGEESLKVSVVLEKVDPDKIHIPQAAEEISMNWRDMLKQMAATKKSVQKQTQNPEHKKKWKLKFRTIETQNPEHKIQWKPNHYTRQGGTLRKDEPVNSGRDVWFDGVDSILLEHQQNKAVPVDLKNNPLVKENSFSGLTHLIALDCEMVGVGDKGQTSILARISIVNHFGHCIYDKYVKPTEKVTDYRTWVSGIRPSDIADGEEFKVVQAEVSEMLRGRVLVGHALHHDMDVLFLKHPKKMVRDTSQYSYFRSLVGGGTPSLKKLSERVLGVKIQDGEHSSVTDAQATMRLYTMHRKAWEKELKKKVTTSTSKEEDNNK